MAEPPLVESSTTTETMTLPQCNDDDNDHCMVESKKTKKKSVNIFKVALMLILGRPAKPNAATAAAVDVASKGMWKRLFSSMRPLHLQSESPLQEVVVSPVGVPAEAPLRASPSLDNFEDVASSLPLSEVPVEPPLRASPSADNFEDVASLPLSPNYIPQSSSVSSIDDMSRYASAVNLHELDQNGKDENENENENESVTEGNMESGDEMIDAKAEMFIAQFYEQMKLQRSDSDIHYLEMITRSIG